MNPKHWQLLLLCIIFVSIVGASVYALGDPEYVGYVVDDETGEPIQDAKVTVFYRRFYRRYSSRWYSTSGTVTDGEGRFELKMVQDRGYLFFVSHETDGETDYVPYGIYHNLGGGTETETIRLWRSATVKLDGRDFFIETPAIPEITIRVLESNGQDPMDYGEVNLYYGSGSATVSTYLDRPSGEMYVPADRGFIIRVTAHVEKGSKQFTETVFIEDYVDGGLSAGELISVDLRDRILPQSFDNIHNKTAVLTSLILDKEDQGFFLAVERQKLGRAESITSAARTRMESGGSEEAFTSLREAYVILTDLENSVTSMLGDAERSVFILVVFIALTSQVVATLLHEDTLKKTAISGVVFIILLAALISLHPGAQITAPLDILRMGTYSLVFVSLAGVLVPRVLQRGPETINASIQHMVIPILSISKRSLRRRKLRFLLTLTSVLLLVASFISLTSFTSGFGLSLEKTLDPIGKDGVMIRTPDPPPVMDKAPFSGGVGASGPLPLDYGLIKWFNEADVITKVIPRYENEPQRQYREIYRPIAYIEGVHIFGILAVNPEHEAEMNQLDSPVVDGEYMKDGGGEAMVSVGMAAKLNASVGDTMVIRAQEKTHELTIVALLDDEKLGALTDLDGDTILPRKIIEHSRVEFDGPDLVVEALTACSPDEVVITNLESSANMTLLKLTRLNLVLEPEADAVEYARTTALNKGFRVWASTGSGVFLAQLTGYFGGKGLPIVIPWVIVVLNVIVTMMNAYYERRQEVMIFSSIGMNPRHISAIFLAEAAVTGILGGCIGYLVGLGAYRFIYLVTPALQVKQKVSAMWSIGAIGISLAAVLIGGLVALRNSVSITPSLTRRWSVGKKNERREETRVELPVHAFAEELEMYTDFIGEKLIEGKNGRDMAVRMLKKNVEDDTIVFSFIYNSASGGIASLYAKNRVVIEPADDGTYSTTLFTDGDDESVKKSGGFMRRLCLDWSMKREGQ